MSMTILSTAEGAAVLYVAELGLVITRFGHDQ